MSEAARIELQKDGFAYSRWRRGAIQDARITGDFTIASLSGKERNHLFLSSAGTRFDDLSGISGIDSIGDSRVFSILDFNRDGWQDIVVINVNAPMLQLYQNRMGEFARRNNAPKNIVALRFVGGNHTSKPDPNFSARDGFGATVTVVSGDLKLQKEHRSGEGLSAQNSATMLIGIGSNSAAQEIVVTWPSGKTQTLKDVKAGSLVTLYENPAQSPNKRQSTVESYLRSIPEKDLSEKNKVLTSAPLTFGEFGKISTKTKLRLFTMTSPSCLACKKKMPILRNIKRVFQEEISMFGVPYELTDMENDAEVLRKYQQDVDPPYSILFDVTDETSRKFVRIVFEHTELRWSPSTIITDDQGRILYIKEGVPSVSDVQKLLTLMK